MSASPAFLIEPESGDPVSKVEAAFIRFEGTRSFRTVPGKPKGTVPIRSGKR
ncbi:hypothetical protein [Methylobacterium sp. W2]|uniref:hypothetical protein n=1 Tax=Methylobacterium sp. W2 TaxID=2598107 RepID=UPI001D0CD618|nr:hypothetical protein [Methylobacterium sp. W2]